MFRAEKRQVEEKQLSESELKHRSQETERQYLQEVPPKKNCQVM